MRKPVRRGAELLFQVLTEREERNSVAIASNESLSGWIKTFTDPRLCGRAGWCSPVWSARLLVWLAFRRPTLPGVQRWCRDRVPVHVRDQVRVEADVAERHVTIVECRPPWRADMGVEWTRFPIARQRFTKSTGLWSLYWRDRNLRFHEYDRTPVSRSVEDLLVEIDRDPTAIFWG